MLLRYRKPLRVVTVRCSVIVVASVCYEFDTRRDCCLPFQVEEFMNNGERLSEQDPQAINQLMISTKGRRRVQKKDAKNMEDAAGRLSEVRLTEMQKPSYVFLVSQSIFAYSLFCM